MSMMKIGWAEKDFTPSKKTSLEGQFAERISEYVEKPVTATALAIEAGGEQIVIVSTDLVDVSTELLSAIRAEVAKAGTDLDPMKIVIGAIHTHTGPSYESPADSVSDGGVGGSKRILSELLPEGVTYVEKQNISDNDEIISPLSMFYILVEKISAAVVEAWNNKKAGGFSNAFGRAAVGMNRRAAYNDGSAAMWGDTNTACFTHVEGGSDTGMELLYVFDDAKKLTGIVINIACPAQCVQHRLFVSPDFWGEVKVLLRERFGEDIFVLALCSAAGDQCPVDIVRWVEPYSDVHDPNIDRPHPLKRKADPSMFDIAGMKKAGKRIAREVIDIFEEGLDEPQVDVPFEHHVHNMQLPIRQATRAQHNDAIRAIKEYLRDVKGTTVNYYDSAMLQVHLGTLGRFESQETRHTLDTEVHVVRLGSIAIATNPFELFLDYGNHIKARSFAEQTFLIQLCCGSMGYLPTETAEKGGHYSAFIASGNVGHEGGWQLVKETLKDINTLFAENNPF